MDNKLEFQQLECYKLATDEQKKKLNKEQYFDLDKLPGNQLQTEFAKYIYYRGTQVSILTIKAERHYFNSLCEFFQKPSHQENSLLDREKEKQVVETVYRKLYTPLGLRTLSPENSEFKPFYGGEMLDRDLAYHQGTVWVFPLGGYYLAYLKVNDYSEEAKAQVRAQLESITAALCEGCIGQLPEIYDGARPVSSKGCFAQAWSVGEILKVYEALEKSV